MISKPLHVETGVNRNLQVTTKPETLQALLGSTNLQDNTASIANVSTEALQILHQNIQGLRWKFNEVLSYLYPSLPHILCFTEHHLNQQEIELNLIESYTLGASFCRTSFKMGGICIFINKNLNFRNVDIRNLIFVVPCIMLYNCEISPTRCNNCVLFFAVALLYMFRATVSPIIRSTYAVYGRR